MCLIPCQLIYYCVFYWLDERRLECLPRDNASVDTDDCPEQVDETKLNK